jgi:hypothetical protein
MSGNVALRNKQLTDYGTIMATAVLTIYSGTPPANADAALSGNTALAAHTLAGFGSPLSGSMTANAIANATITGSGTNTATFARLVAGSYTEQLAVGTSGTPVIVTTTSYVSGGTSQITSLTLTRGA